LKRYLIKILCLALVLVCVFAEMGAMSPRQQEEPKAEVMPVVQRVSPAPVVEVVAYEPAPEPEPEISEEDAVLLARTLYGEYRGTDKLQQAAVCWCILNRCDRYDQSVEAVVTAPNQFTGYSSSHPVDDELYDTAVDVLRRHAREKAGESDVGRILPKDYLWFTGNGTVNTFRNGYSQGKRWDWSLPDPYTEA